MNRPRVLVTLGGLPRGSGVGQAKGRVRVPYKEFLLIYSGKASARDIGNLAMQRKVGFCAFLLVGLGWGPFMYFSLADFSCCSPLIGCLVSPVGCLDLARLRRFVGLSVCLLCCTYSGKTFGHGHRHCYARSEVDVQRKGFCQGHQQRDSTPRVIAIYLFLLGWKTSTR